MSIIDNRFFLYAYCYLYNAKYYLKYAKNKNSALNSKKSYLIHVPKAAGTSVCSALEVVDPGHFVLTDTEAENCTSPLIVYRDPVDRIVSTFKYAKNDNHAKINSPLWLVNRFDSVEKFVCSNAFSVFAKKHYFFRHQHLMISKKAIEFSNCKVIRFSHVGKDFYEIYGIRLGNKNVSMGGRESTSDVGELLANKIKNIYSKDYEFFEEIGVNP